MAELKADHAGAVGRFFASLLQALPPRKVPIVWQGAVSWLTELPAGATVQFWRQPTDAGLLQKFVHGGSGGSGTPRTASSYTPRTLSSYGLYLDSTDRTWDAMYFDPPPLVRGQMRISRKSYSSAASNLGGEACMWSEASNMHTVEGESTND